MALSDRFVNNTGLKNSFSNKNDFRILQITGGAPTDGANGTGAGYAGKGSLCFSDTTGTTDVTNATATSIYINTGTKASPTWVMLIGA